METDSQSRNTSHECLPDLIIPVMGVTGVGKSTFINAAAGADVAAVGHAYESCTQNVTPISIFHPRQRLRRILFVDTPGFDDTFKDDDIIWRQIIEWIQGSFNNNRKIAGVIYLYDITQERFPREVRTVLAKLVEVLGDNGCSNVVLTTTKWDLVRQGVGRRCEMKLIKEHWAKMIMRGSTVKQFRHACDFESVWDIVDLLAGKTPLDKITIPEVTPPRRKQNFLSIRSLLARLGL